MWPGTAAIISACAKITDNENILGGAKEGGTSPKNKPWS